MTGDNRTGEEVLERPEAAHRPCIACKCPTQVCANNISEPLHTPHLRGAGPVPDRVSFGADSASPSVPTRCTSVVNAVHRKAITPPRYLLERGNFECEITAFEEKLVLFFMALGSSHTKETPTPVPPKHPSHRPGNHSGCFMCLTFN